MNASSASRRLLRLLALTSGLWALSPSLALAQASAVPSVISYQGKVTDAAGALVGDATPVNRDVIFRIYDGPTAVVPLYSERQNVTISKGEFSVLVGVGGVVGSELKPALDTVFTGAQRFLGVTVDDGNAGADLEISPRQQIATTPFAYRAKVAETLVGNAVSSPDMIANNTITSVKIVDSAITSAKIADAAILADDLATASVTSAKIANGTIIAEDLANQSVTAAKLAADVGVWSVNGANLFRNSSVSVGTNTIQSGDRLYVSGGNLRLDLEQSLAFGSYPENFTYNTKSMPVYGVGTFKDSDLGASATLWLSSYDGVKFFAGNQPRMTIRNGGQVGIGITNPNPVHKLVVYSGDDSGSMAIQTSTTGVTDTDGLRLGLAGSSHGFIYCYEPIPLKFRSGTAQPLNIYPDKRVGLGGENTALDTAVLIKNTDHLYPLTIEMASGPNIIFRNTGHAFKPGGGDWSSSSDIRLKTDVADLTGALEKLLRLHSVTFRFKDESRYGAGVQTGFIAQEVEQVFPSWVTDGPDGFKAVGAIGFDALAVQALRELRAEKDAQIAAAEKRATDAEARLAALEKQVAALVAAQR